MRGVFGAGGLVICRGTGGNVVREGKWKWCQILMVSDAIFICNFSPRIRKLFGYFVSESAITVGERRLPVE